MTSVNTESGNESLHQRMLLLGKMARQAARVLEKTEEDERNAALEAAAAKATAATAAGDNSYQMAAASP